MESKMQVPTVGSKIRVRMSYSQGPKMFPPSASFREYQGEVIKPYKWLSDRQFCMTGDNEMPVRVITVNLVEDIQLLAGKFATVNTQAKVYTVAGSKGNSYTVTSNGRGWDCTCSGFQFRKQCKHVSELSGVKVK
jgi:hypothetical protein